MNQRTSKLLRKAAAEAAPTNNQMNSHKRKRIAWSPFRNMHRKFKAAWKKLTLKQRTASRAAVLVKFPRKERA